MPERLRVATFNTLYYPQGDRWRERLPVAGGQLAELEADVVGLQEVDRARDRDRALAALAPALDYRLHRATETQRDRYPRHWDGLVALVAPRALTVVDHRVLRLTHLRVVQALDLRTRGGRLVRFANTHLHHVDGSAGFEVRRRQGGAILAWLDELAAGSRPDLEVLVGDLNAVPTEPVIAALAGGGFRPTYAALDRRPVATFASGLVASSITPGPPRVCLDYIFVRGAVEVATAGLAFDRPAADDPGLFPSDHLGVFADLDLAGPESSVRAVDRPHAPP
jgi:endonuclease/exonuclease/phosphatase family metal-dependent hydrolase